MMKKLDLSLNDNLKAVLIFFAVLIALVSLFVSNSLIEDMKNEERVKMEVWANAMKSISEADENSDLSLALQVLNGNNTIPVVVLDEDGNIQNYRNLDISKNDSISSLYKLVSEVCASGKNIRFHLDDEGGVETGKHYVDIYYDDSILLKRLALYPYVQLSVVIIFVIIAGLLLSNLKKIEQNRVWVGLSKETAHQLGTPISSLLAWQELLEDKYPDDDIVKEMKVDVQNLRIVADRFSKIGSEPETESCNITEIISDKAAYISKRISNKIEVSCENPAHPIVAMVNRSLFEWVIENLCKNAADAMDGTGKLLLRHGKDGNVIWVEVSDTGRGIPKSKFKSVFKPGFTTKKRGWGLGLSLSQRIIKEYHKGRIFIKSSELNKGTTFRIEIKDLRIV